MLSAGEPARIVPDLAQVGEGIDRAITRVNNVLSETRDLNRRLFVGSSPETASNTKGGGEVRPSRGGVIGQLLDRVDELHDIISELQDVSSRTNNIA